MAVAVVHATQATGTNDGSKQVSKDAWNQGHTVTGLGSAAEAATTDFATAAQGTKADSAVQPGTAYALTTVSGTDADTVMTTNRFYVVNIANWATADRIYTLPASPTVGDRVGVMIQGDNASFELILKGNTGQAIVSGLAATEWSRLFIATEVVVFRYIATDLWNVELDGRIPQKGFMYISTAPDGESAATYTQPTAASSAGVWTVDTNVGSVCSASNDRITARRAGLYRTVAQQVIKDSPTDQQYASVGLFQSAAATQVTRGHITFAASAAIGPQCIATQDLVLATDDYLVYKYRTQAGGLGLNTGKFTSFSVVEVLP